MVDGKIEWLYNKILEEARVVGLEVVRTDQSITVGHKLAVVKIFDKYNNAIEVELTIDRDEYEKFGKKRFYMKSGYGEV